MAATEYKADLRWVDGSNRTRLTDQTKTPDAAAALAAFRTLLLRDDLAGLPVAARFVVAGRSLYFSKFDAPFGAGRIHPDAPLDPRASSDIAETLARWLPVGAARPGLAGGEGGARAASEAQQRASSEISAAAGAYLVEWLSALAREAPEQFRAIVELAAEAARAPRAGGLRAVEAARSVIDRAASAAGL